MKKSKKKTGTKTRVLSVDRVKRDMLVSKPYAYAGKREVEVAITHGEFTSLCPMTQLPDFGTIIINYVPERKIIELKSLKYYLLQYRSVGVFYEHVVNRILDDLVATIKPKWMEVHGEFTPRGGLTTTVTALYEREE